MRFLFSTMIMLFAVITFGQKMPSDYFEEASKAFGGERFEEALNGYQYIVDNHPKNELYTRAFYYVGFIHFIQKEYGKAISIFKRILESDFNEKENLGGDIMADPNTVYKRSASEMVSELYYNDKNYEAALYYLALADSMYPYLLSCGNLDAYDKINKALRFADIYQKLNQPQKAIEKLLPTVFVHLADNSKVIEELRKLLAKRRGLKKKLDKSIAKMYFKEVELGGYSYSSHFIKFLNVEIAILANNEYEIEEFDKTKTVENIKQRLFYKMIEHLR